MRTIKLRVYDTIEKRYLKSYEYYYYISPNGDIEAQPRINGKKHILGVRDRYILEQFTGLYDKNGKEIYEGDIVKLSDGYSLVMPIAYKGEITFDKEGYWKCGRTPLHEMPIEYYEVIGNIHEDNL